MRLGIFIAFIVALILVCRFYSLPPNGQQSKVDSTSESGQAHAASIPSVAAAIYEEPVPGNLLPDPLQDQANLHRDNRSLTTASPVVRPLARIQTARVYRPSTELYGRVATDELAEATPVSDMALNRNANNVQTLVRAQYEIPKAAAETLMQLETDVLVETVVIDSGHPETTIFQVTTDEATQKQISGFLSAFYPRDLVENLKERNCQRTAKSETQTNQNRGALPASHATIQR